MRFFCVGLEPGWIAALRDREFEAISCLTPPDPETVGEHGMFITSDDVPVTELTVFREKYPEAELVYAYKIRGVAGWQAVAVMCDRLNMRFLRPGIGRETLLEQMDIWYRSGDPQGKVIGIFGAAAGIGVTSIAATMAQTMARLGNKVTMLGLNVYHAGWGKDATVSLDRWRQRLISRMLQHEDLQTLIQVNGFRYLPGNDDLLASLDYVEEEIEHLLDVAQQEADVIIADFGAIPESSAWLCGLQRSAIRLMVTHPAYTKRLIALMKLSKHMGVSSEHWHVIGNRIESDQLPLKSIAALHGMLPLLSLPDKGRTSSFALPLNKKEEEQVEEAVRPLLASLGMATSAKRKGGL